MKEHTGILHLFYRLEPEKRTLLRRLLRNWDILDLKIIEEISRFAKRFVKVSRESKGKESE